MKLYAKGCLALSLDFNNNFTTITLDNENLLKLQDAIGFYYFKEDFNNFLELAHESACIADCSEHDAIKKFWKLYKDAQDMNIAEWDTFSNIYEAAKSIDGFWWTCSHCGCDVFGELPEVDGYGNVYCDSCSENYTGYCDYCDCKYDREAKLYFVGEDKRICQACLHRKLKDGSLELEEREKRQPQATEQ